MGLSGAIINVLTQGFDRGRKPRKLYAQPANATAKIVGINYSEGVDGSPDVTELALQVEGASPLLCGVEQQFEPSDRLRLGQVVDVRVERDRAVVVNIDGTGLNAVEPRWFCNPPPAGITDASLWDHVMSRRTGLPATISFTEARAQQYIGVAKIMATAVVEGPEFETFTTETDRVPLRPYSSHLEQLDLPLPGWARPGKRNEFVVDWAAAANYDQGLEAPPGYFRELMADITPAEVKGL